MPTVPTYGTPKVDRAALPGFRVQTGAPGEAFAPAPPLDLRAAQQVVGDYIADNKKKADQLAVTDAESQLADYETTLLYDPKTGLLNRHGKDAFSSSQDFNDNWQQKVSEVSNQLGNDDQKAAFDIASKQRHSDINRVIQHHVSNEIANYDNQTTESAVSNERNTAIASYNDPERIDLAIQRQAKWIAERGRRLGMPDEQIAEEVNKAVSSTHVGVISRMLANEEDLNAKAYYDKHKIEISGADTVNVEKSLEEGSARGESQRQTDQIVKKFLDRSSALEEVSKIKDPRVRDMTEERVNAFFSRKRQALTEMREDLYMQSTNMIDAHLGQPARAVVPPHIWSKLSLEQRNALENRAENKDGPNDDRKWLEFLDLRPSVLGQMSQAEFETKYWSGLDKSHKERAAMQWANARDAVEKGAAKNAQHMSDIDFNKRVTLTLRNSGLISANKPIGKLNQEQTQLYSRFEAEAIQRINEFELTQLQGKRKATGLEKQKIMDELLINKVFLDKTFSFDHEYPLFYVKEEEQNKAYVPLDKIPQPDADYIRGLIRRSNTQITTDKIQRAYAASKLNNRPLFDSIISEK
jgi:hypothetical protein